VQKANIDVILIRPTRLLCVDVSRTYEHEQ
jgi:hypothetical protein